ncbi:MAG: helix-turn-helix transcriptional regulator [Leptolyngbya sp. SIO4C5]|nr:helix-turn-helix transcriptional regulator [Leptolyngbya sp. SIO4C5]
MVIFDYTLQQDLVMDLYQEKNCVEFAFHLDSLTGGKSYFCPYFGGKGLGFRAAGQRFSKVEVWCRQGSSSIYLRSFLERLHPQTVNVVQEVVQQLFPTPRRRPYPALADILTNESTSSIASESDLHSSFQRMSDSLFADLIALQYAQRQSITSRMEQVIGNILSCPYQGSTRRTYLTQQALALIALRFEAMEQPNLNSTDLATIYQAAAILRARFVNPPSIEELTRQVATNRLKLNQGFHKVYGTTPFGYLRDCRLWQAQRLLMTTELSIGQVATEVGYGCRSKFAIAFRKYIGVNPKAFQMHALPMAS